MSEALVDRRQHETPGGTCTAFLRALGGSFAQRCPGGIAPAGSGDALALECARSGVLGTRAGIVIMSTVLVWAALHYLLAARTLRSDLVTASARTRRKAT